MKPRVTQADIARRAGVHTTTVSLSLRNNPSIPAATRERIRAIAAELGYQPDPALQALMAYRSQLLPNRRIATLAYVTNWDSARGWQRAPAHAQFFAGASRRASQLGYQLEHFWLGETGMNPRRLGDIFFHRGITGLILASHRDWRAGPLDFDWSRFSAVKIDCFPREPALHQVTNDQRAIIRLAVRRTLAAGYRRIGFVMPWWWDDFVDLAWSAGFLAEQERLPAADRIPILFYAENSLADFPPARPDCPVPRQAFEKWFRRYRPEVIISYGPFVRPLLDQPGLRVPSEVAYVDIFADPADKRTAGVRQNCERVGEVAVEILAGQLQQHACGLPAAPTATLVEGTWIDGASLPNRAAAARSNSARSRSLLKAASEIR